MNQNSPHPLIDLSPTVADALDQGEPVVALESAIITHGMPYPRNVETALDVESTIRSHGATPAAVVIERGRIRIGLDDDDIDRIGQIGPTATKVSRRDLPFVLEAGGVGGTTVATTMIAADLAGIEVFATGGIGGVHRGAGTSFDVSADLQELARTSVVVVCAGAKSILDLPATLEYLETHGVPMIGFGTDVLPAFYTRDSDLAVDYRIDEPEGVARIMAIRASLGMTGGMVVANPIPVEHSMDRSVIEAAIDQSIAEAERDGIIGGEVTPYLLARIIEITGTASLDANRNLVPANASVAARIAVARADDRRDRAAEPAESDE